MKVYLKESELKQMISDSIRDIISEGVFDIFKKKGQNPTQEQPNDEENAVPENHIYSAKELQWLYDNQDKINDFQRKVLSRAMWVRAMRANYHGYHKNWFNICVKNGEIYYWKKNGELDKTP